MSLSTFLKDNADVRARFRAEFEKPKLSAQKEMIASPFTTSYTTVDYTRVGTAFDYLLRFKLMHLNKVTETSRRWIAENAVVSLAGNKLAFKKSQKIVVDAKEHLSTFLKTGEMSENLIKSSLLLATLDPIFRSGFGIEHIGRVNPDTIKDLTNLITLIDLEMFRAKSNCLLNPTFGKASELIGGADADLIIDGTLIDIKTTINFRFDEAFFQQLMGYYSLNCINSEDRFGEDSEIKTIAIYYARHGYLQKIQLDEIVDRVTFPQFLKWFKNEILEKSSSRR
jgi:hypothetical protein